MNYAVGDDFRVINPITGCTVGNIYTISSTYVQNHNRYFTFVGDNLNMIDVHEKTLLCDAMNLGPASVSAPSGWMLTSPNPLPPSSPTSAIHFTLPPDYMADIMWDGPPLTETKTFKCVCGAKAVGLSETSQLGHSSWCDIVTRKHS